MTITQSAVREALWPENLPSRMNVYAILDGARDKRIFEAVLRTYQEKCCLFAGDLPWQVEQAAPHLVQLDPDEALTRVVCQQGWGNAWGIFLRTETSFVRLRKHLRRFLRVRDERGKWMLFRYYDPRVMRIYLPTCNAHELETVFGPIDTFVVEDAGAVRALEYRMERNKLKITEVPLPTA
ncbi:MAG TPA: DUF4123 domain-containing protein [Solibacterales bacterium]|nr:DUF4123 domain-containing protein [Bryobacterales bacterium]